MRQHSEANVRLTPQDEPPGLPPIPGAGTSEDFGKAEITLETLRRVLEAVGRKDPVLAAFAIQLERAMNLLGMAPRA